MNLPRGHLSPSQLSAWDLCHYRYAIFNTDLVVTGGARAKPDFTLEAKKTTHVVVLERDLGQKIMSGINLANSELSEMYRSIMEEHALPVAREDENLEMPAQKAVEEEIKYFDTILDATKEFRHATKPLEVEKSLSGHIGGVPVEARLDLVADEAICTRVEDLKRQGQAPPAGSAAKNRQLATYAALTGIPDVGLVAVVENKKPVVKREQGQVTPQEIKRLESQYQAAAFEIENAVKAGVFAPVDHGDPRKAWVCTARFCGAWKVGSKDARTGTNISCPWGERSEVRA
jgi:hypothetical protein